MIGNRLNIHRPSSWIPALLTALLSICSACQPENVHSPTKDISDKNHPQAESPQTPSTAGNHDADAENGQETTPHALNKPDSLHNKEENPCKAGGTLADGQCTCGTIKQEASVASQWGCIGNKLLRCMHKDGCTWNGMKYPQRTEIRDNQIYCGNESVPNKPDGFICAFNRDKPDGSKHSWTCVAAQCDCNGIIIDNGSECMAKGLMADNGGVYRTQQDKEMRDPECGGIHYSEIPVDYKNNFKCDNNKWTCHGELICAKGKWFCVEEGYEKVELCQNVCATEHYDNFSICNHIKDEDDSVIPCETLPKDQYNDYVDNKYGELYGSTCGGYLGGYCRYGYNKNKESETCEPWDSSKFGGTLSNKAYGEYSDFGLMHGNVWLEEKKDTICIDGNCKCGDGACPQFAYCEEGQCYCGTAIGTGHGEFYCEIITGNSHTEWAIDSTHALKCQDKKGCKTAEGRSYKNGDIICITDHSFCEPVFEDDNDADGVYSICDNKFMKIPSCGLLASKAQKTGNADEAAKTDETADSGVLPPPAVPEFCQKGFIYDALLQRCVYALNGFTPDKTGKHLASLAPEYSNGLIRRCVQGDYQNEVCVCGDIKLNDLVTHDCAIVHGKGYEICALSTGCACGDAICPNTTSCLDGQCIDPITNQPVGGLSSLPGPGCKDGANCGCGNSTCKDGEFCYHEQCHQNFFASLWEGKRRVFNLSKVFEYLGDSDNEVANQKFNNSDFLYFQTDVDDGFVIYPSIDCVTDYRDEECGDDPFCIVTGGPSGNECMEASWRDGVVRCDLHEGCACGDSVCKWGGICDKGKCQYDAFYNEFWFGEGNSDEKGYGVCSDTILPPKWGFDLKASYLCTEFGWVCRMKDGCACGDSACPAGSICIQPGVCSESMEPCQNDVDIHSNCCESGVFDYNGNCCKNGVSYGEGDNKQCCETGVIGRIYGICGQEQCCETGVLNPHGQCCPKELLGQDGQCLCNNYIEANECKEMTHAKDSPYARVLNINCFKCPDEFVDANGQCNCSVLSESGQCCPTKFIGTDGKCQCKGIGGHSLRECCEEGIQSEGSFVKCKCKYKSRNVGSCCDSGVVDETSNGSTGFCCVNGVQNSKGGCCPDEFIGTDGKCQCAVDNVGKCCASGLIAKDGTCCAWYGVKPSDYRPSVLTKDGDCCLTGVLTNAGQCCPKRFIDDKGNCNCKEDVHGECCYSGVLSKDGSCCQEENVKKGKCVNSVANEENDKQWDKFIDKRGDVCETGILSESGYCCPVHYANEDGSCTCSADFFGKCCVGIVDLNGFCCGSGVLDNRGVCCHDGVKNRFGWCCESILQEGGVCIQ